MGNHNNQLERGLNIRLLLNRVCRGAVGVFILLIFLEVILQLSSFVFIRAKYRIKNPEIVKEGSFRIIFIGDSWTAGGDAPPNRGYVPLTLEKLNRAFPGMNIQGYNFSCGSTNSSQAIHQFLDNYRKIKPHILVVMTGVNDCWNTQDIPVAQKRIANEIYINNKYEAIKFGEYANKFLKRLKLVKLYDLILYNLFYKQREEKIPFDFKNQYSVRYFNILESTEDFEKTREFLINNYKEWSHDYNEFYKLVLHSFGGDAPITLDYLRNKNMLKKKFIKERVDIRKQEKYLRLRMEILEKNLTDLKLLCDQQDIIMVIENYPHLVCSEYPDKLLDEISKKLNVFYADHYIYFKNNISYEEWSSIQTLAHVNYKGHEYMADNLFNILTDIIAGHKNI